VYERRLPNDLAGTLGALEPYRAQVVAVAVESTFNWYWLVDGLMQAGYEVRLVNPSAVKVYEGLKHTDDQHDAFWLAHLMRLGILPCGYIYPKNQRGLRDLGRQRIRLVQHRSALLVSLQNQLWRSTAIKLCVRELQDRGHSDWPELSDENLKASADSIQATVEILSEQIALLEKRLLRQVKLTAIFKALCSVPGIGLILALTIMLEVGDIHRFASVGQFASYCRCVRSERISNGKKKGENNRKCGNPYLAWAFLALLTGAG
jgi:transposase